MVQSGDRNRRESLPRRPTRPQSRSALVAPCLKIHAHQGQWCKSPGILLFPSHGSVGQIVRDSVRGSRVLVGMHEQTHTSDLPHDELALL